MTFPAHLHRVRLVTFVALLLALLAPAAWPQASVVLTFSSSPNPAVQGAPVTFTAGFTSASMTMGVPTGTMTFYANGSPLNDDQTSTSVVNLDSTGTAYLTHSFPVAGTYTVYAHYSGDGTYLSKDSAPLTETINASLITTSTRLTSSLNPSTVSDTVTLAAQILVPLGRRNPTGIVTFCDLSTISGATDPVCGNNVVLGAANVITSASGGEEFFHFATLAVSPGSLAVGTHEIQAFYPGDSSFAKSNSSILAQVVQESNPSPSTTNLTSSANPSFDGQSVTFTATVTSTGSGAVTGTVQFFKDGVLAGSSSVDANGEATFAMTLSQGTYGIEASYGGSTNFAASTSTTLTQTVNPAPLAPTTVAVTASNNQPHVGDSVSFTATVTPISGTAGGTPTGTVSFTLTYSDGSSASLGSPVSLDQSGVASSAPTSLLAIGPNTVTASYSGDANFQSSVGTVTVVAGQPTNIASITTVTSSANPASYGQTLSFKATVTDSSGTDSAGTPTGMVSFTLTSTPASGPVSVTTATETLDGSGLAVFTSSDVPVGDTSVVAVYSGDGIFDSSQSSVDQTVSAAPTTTALTSSLNPAVFGKLITFTATVTSATGVIATGTVDFKDGASDLGSVTLDATGTAAIPVSTLSVGQHNIIASFTGSTNFVASDSDPLSQSVTQASTTVTLTSSSSSTTFGTTVTLTAVVSAGGDPPTGLVDFKDGTTDLGSVQVDANGTAQLNTSALSVGSHNIIAIYVGDANFQGSSSAALVQSVTQASTSTAVTASANSATFGTSVSFTAVVTGVGTNVTPTGTVSFRDTTSGLDLGSATLDASGKAQVSTSSLSVGSHNIAVTFSGDANFSGSSSSASQSITQASTSTAVTSSANPASFGASVTFTAVVTGLGTNVTPTGTVNFHDATSGLDLGSVSLDGGKAQVNSASLSAGSHSITVTYSGDANFLGSGSALVQGIAQASTTVTVSASTSTSTFGAPVTFTAVVSANAGSAGLAVRSTGFATTGSSITPTGSVTFKDAGVTIGSAQLNGGSAILTVSLSAGSHSITATYSGDANFSGSDSSSSAPPVVSTVSPASTKTTLVWSSNTALTGTPVTFTATVASSTGVIPTGTVDFLDGTSIIASGIPLNGSGQAQQVISFSVVGTHNISAAYAGNPNLLPSASVPVSVLVSSPNPPPSGSADLAIVEFDADRRVEPGDSLTYEVTAINLGRGIANAVKLTDALPPGTTFLKASTNRGTCSGPAVGQTGTVTCDLASLATYGEWSVLITVRVRANRGSTLSDTVSVTSSTPDPNILNNSATVVTRVVFDD